ncbi:MAG: hypothetical protein ACM31C_17290 [Acidobacteriota bacterium]
MRCSRWLPLLLLACACGKDDGTAAAQKPAEPASGRKLAGVYPDQFKCESLTTLEALGQVLGGQVHVIDTPMSVPKGVPHPCNYEVNGEPWTYDIDCRDGAKQRADALFAQYKQDSADMVQHYNALADAGIKPTDAGIAIHAPEAASEVQVGAKGLDHHGQGLFFYDDDAPCYVRVVGPDASKRLELARLVAKNLTFANAPMTPRPMR